MLNFENGLSYDNYMKLGTDEDKQMNIEFYKKSPIHNEDITLSSDEASNIVVFSMTRCKDAATVTPILMQIAKSNPNVTVNFFDRDGNEELLEKLTGEVRIPTILKLDSKGNIRKKFLEFPTVVKEEINKNPENKESIVSSFRENKYFNEIKKDILSFF